MPSDDLRAVVASVPAMAALVALMVQSGKRQWPWLRGWQAQALTVLFGAGMVLAAWALGWLDLDWQGAIERSIDVILLANGGYLAVRAVRLAQAHAATAQERTTVMELAAVGALFLIPRVAVRALVATGFLIGVREATGEIDVLPVVGPATRTMAVLYADRGDAYLRVRAGRVVGEVAPAAPVEGGWLSEDYREGKVQRWCLSALASRPDIRAQLLDVFAWFVVNRPGNFRWTETCQDAPYSAGLDAAAFCGGDPRNVAGCADVGTGRGGHIAVNPAIDIYFPGARPGWYRTAWTHEWLHELGANHNPGGATDFQGNHVPTFMVAVDLSSGCSASQPPACQLDDLIYDLLLLDRAYGTPAPGPSPTPIPTPAPCMATVIDQYWRAPGPDGQWRITNLGERQVAITENGWLAAAYIRPDGSVAYAEQFTAMRPC